MFTKQNAVTVKLKWYLDRKRLVEAKLQEERDFPQLANYFRSRAYL